MFARIKQQLLGEGSMSTTLGTAIIAYLLITPIDAILYLQWINTMANYKWIAGGVICPVLGFLFFFFPTLFLLYKKQIISFFDTKCHKNFVSDYVTYNLKSMEGIKKHSMNYPNFELAQIGCMDSLGGIMSALSIPFISIMLNVITSKLVLPLTMIASYIFLKKRYFLSHYFGVGLTIFGVLVAAIPKLVIGNSSTNPAWMMVFICSLIPGVASFIIKESYLKKYKDSNPWYMNTIICVFQIGIGIMSLVLIKLPIPGVYVDDFGLYIKNSLSCQFAGVNSMDGDNCKYSLLYLLMFQIFGTAANILMFTIINEGSAVMFIMFNTLKTPITALMGFFLIYYNVISYTKEESFVITWLDVVSLVLVCIGSGFYAMKKEIEFQSTQYSSVAGDDNKKIMLSNPLIVGMRDEENLLETANEDDETF